MEDGRTHLYVVVWKGFWEILDDVYETYKWRASIGGTGAILVYLLLIGSLQATMGTPLGTGFFVDMDQCYLYIPTMWQMEVRLNLVIKRLYILTSVPIAGQPFSSPRGRLPDHPGLPDAVHRLLPRPMEGGGGLHRLLRKE